MLAPTIWDNLTDIIQYDLTFRLRRVGSNVSRSLLSDLDSDP